MYMTFNQVQEEQRKPLDYKIDRAVEAIGEGFRSLLISTVRQVVVILPAAYFLSRFFGVTGVWMSFPIAEVVAFLLVLIIFRSTYRKKILTMETK